MHRNFETNILRTETVRPLSQFLPSCTVCICEQFIYSYTISFFFPRSIRLFRLWEFINFSHTHECGNWERGGAVSFLGYINWIFFVVHGTTAEHLYYPVGLSLAVHGTTAEHLYYPVGLSFGILCRLPVSWNKELYTL